MAGVDGLIFRQLFEKESSTYTYLLADAESKEVNFVVLYMRTQRNSTMPMQHANIPKQRCTRCCSPAVPTPARNALAIMRITKQTCANMYMRST